MAEMGALTRQRAIFRVGPVRLDEARMELLVDGVRRPIEAKPLALLHALLRRGGGLATKRELIEAVWGNADHISQASLTTAMSKLRAALGEKGRDIIDVVHGAGYRIDAPVEVTGSREAPVLALALKPGDPVPGRPQWRLEDLLGAPALNAVWLARHAKTGEARVFKFADSEQRLETLQREATISRVLAAAIGTRIDLVRILEWNFEERPWFIESAYGGTDLLIWAETDDRLRARPLDERVAMVARIARTIAAAHAAGVLHGDIKPANILVEETDCGAPHLRLADFGAGGLSGSVRLDALAISLQGLADAEGEPGHGTLHYMPPEVLAGATPTTGADVYALGILLYQIAVGDLRKPLSVGWEEAVADPLLREDIAAAAAGDPQRRLASAAGLAERLEQLPARRAAQAAAQAAAAQALLLARQVERARLRRPWAIAAAVSLVAGLAASSIFGLRAARDRDQLLQRSEMLQSVNAFLTEDLLGRGNPAQSGKADETLMEAAEAAEAGIDHRFAGEPLMAGSIYLSLARAFESRSAFGAARAAYLHGISDFQAAGPRGEADALMAGLHQASMEVLSGQPGSMARARAIVDAAAAAVPSLGERRDEAEVWLANSRAMLEMLGGDVRHAQAGFKRAADQADRMPHVFDEGTRLALRQREAFTYLRLGEWDTARRMITQLLQRRQALSGPRHPETLRLARNLAQVRIAQGEAEAALTEINRLIPDFVSVFGPDNQDTLILLATRARAFSQLQRYDEAMADDQVIYQRALARQGPKSFFALGTRMDVAQAQCLAGHADAGVATARASLAQAAGAFGPHAVLTQIASATLASCLIIDRQFAEAAPLLEELDVAALSQFTIDPNFGAELDLMRAAIADSEGDRDRATKLLAKVGKVFEAPGADRYFQLLARQLQQHG
jgi:DNA-binding winged helix-turn-helix (wHTH) protein